jgi:hypothetical protein
MSTQTRSQKSPTDFMRSPAIATIGLGLFKTRRDFAPDR